MTDESERKTRRKRIDPKLDAAGWLLRGKEARRTEEEETSNGPADYALWLDTNVVGVVEAKKVTLGPQNVLTQAERYARGLPKGSYDFEGLRCPFLYSTNGEVIWFHDVRHPLNRSRRVSRFHTPAALQELLGRDFDAASEKLLALPNGGNLLRPYQRDANAAVEKAIADRKRNLLVAMATGTGKTYTLVNQIYRLMKSGVAKRVLFLVDRRALAAQAVRAFSSFEAEPGQKFDHIYEVYSSKFQTEDFGEDEKFDPKVMPQRYLTDPQAGHAFVYVATIQRMAMHVLGRQAIFGAGDETIDEDADKLDIPIHAFDVIVADECHRGYTSQEVSMWRSTLDHFDATKIGLTATPASHTTAYFTNKVFEYPYETAVRDGHLVDYDVVNVRSNVRMQGVFLKEGENVEVVDPETGLSKMDQLEDERPYDATELERTVTSPESNRKVVEEVKKYADEHEKRHGRFPKTLFFAVNDLPHTSHADQLVDVARDVFGRGDSFVEKITGRVDRPLQKIREFRNRPNPGIAVTVDLLTTGVDIPDLEYIVFMRPVKSRILFEQMVGRGTRKGEKFTDKDHFTVFDCFDGTLLAYFKNSTGITAEEPTPPTRTVEEIVKSIWDIHTYAKRRHEQNLLVGELTRLLEPAPAFTKLAIEKIETRNLTQAVVESWAPIVGGALNEWARQRMLTAALAATTATDSKSDANGKLEPSQEELDAFAVVTKLLGRDRAIAYEDSAAYFKIHLAEKRTWVFCRLQLGRRHPVVWVPLPLEKATELACGRAVGVNSGWAVVTLNAAAELSDLRELLEAAYAHVKHERAAHDE